MKRSNTGSALILVVSLSTILLLVAVAASMSSVSDIGITNEEKIKTKLELACESALNRGRAKIEESFNNSNLTELEPSILFEGEDEDTTELSPDDKAFSDEEYNIGSGDEPDYYSFQLTDETDNEKPIYVKYAIKYNGSDIDTNNGWKRGQANTTYPIEIEAIAYSPGFGWVGMNETASAKRSTLFMYNIFFEDELEILPGPNFNLKGLIHTNKDMYLSSNNNLYIYTDSMTAAGEMYRRRMNNTDSTGTVKITTNNEDGSLESMGRSPKEDSTNTDWVNMATEKWEGTVRDKHLGATKLKAPDLKSFAPGGFYDKNAGLRIKVLAKNRSTPIYQITYNNSVTLTNADLDNAITETTFYDRRESTSKKVKATEIDVKKLGDSGYWPSNGLVYITRDDAVKDTDGNIYTPDPNRNVSGVKLTNGSELENAVTFVTDLPAYVKGDFNLHTSTDPMADKWKACAVVADAINILSNSWVDSQSSSKRTASSTTYNMVFITGNVPTNSNTGQYSGGLENFPRMLENWDGKTLTIKGGMMQLFRSQYATGTWGGSYYNPPNRNWSSEDSFENLSDFPPLFTNLFPSTNMGIVYGNWSKISKDESNLITEEIEDSEE
ncbi:MAG: hypothetical protein AB7V50_07815 [Vampirovibrionia bacterium]